MNKAINFFGQSNKYTELSYVSDFTFYLSPNLEGVLELFPWIGCGLFQAK